MKNCYLFILLLLLLSCGPSPKELFQTAELEFLQANLANARQLYQHLVEKHPDSEFAAKAGQRLSDLQSREIANSR